MQYISGANDKDSPKDYITGSNRSVWKRYLILMSQPPANMTLALLWPYLAMVPGILIGMVLNYVFSRFWVFSPAKL